MVTEAQKRANQAQAKKRANQKRLPSGYLTEEEFLLLEKAKELTGKNNKDVILAGLKTLIEQHKN